MSSRQLAPPFFSDPPHEYNAGYFAQLTRAFAQFVSQEKNPGEGRNTTLVITEMQEGDAGLEAGTLFRDGNTVKIAMNHIAAPVGFGMTASLGSVTVSTP